MNTDTDVYGPPTVTRRGDAIIQTRVYRPTGEVGRFHAVHLGDTSDVHRGPYDADCGGCWLGFGHTVDFHTRYGRSVELRIVRNDSGATIIRGRYADSTVECPASVCVQQAHYVATQCRPRSTDRVTVVDHTGAFVEPADWPTCGIDRAHTMWDCHGHTHTGRTIGATGQLSHTH
jgi:hypothetical protein